MNFYISNGYGDSEDSPSLETMRSFLAQLDPLDKEHGAAWVADEDENHIEWDVSGTLAFHQSNRVRHLSQVSRDRALSLWRLFVEGRLEELEREPWQPGQGNEPTDDERRAHAAEISAATLASDRKFYSSFGAERSEVPCKAAECGRGSIPLSVFCKRHHFEQITGRACPFESAR